MARMKSKKQKSKKSTRKDKKKKKKEVESQAPFYCYQSEEPKADGIKPLSIRPPTILFSLGCLPRTCVSYFAERVGGA